MFDPQTVEDVQAWLQAQGINHGPVLWNPSDGHCLRCYHPDVPYSFIVSLEQFDANSLALVEGYPVALLRETPCRVTVYDYNDRTVVTRLIHQIAHAA